MNVIEIVLLGCALYILFMTFRMKATRNIPRFFVNAKIDIEKAKDKEGYIDFMTPRLIVFSLALAAFSGVALLSEFFSLPFYVSIITNVAYIALLVVYAVISVKAQTKYLM